MYIFFLILLFISFTACSSEPIHIKLANEITTEFSKKVRQTDNLILIGSGGAMMADIEKFSFYFEKIQSPSLSEARILIVRNIEKFLYSINNNEEIRYYMHEYPFNIKNIDFSIGFVTSKGNFVDSPHIAHVFSCKGNIVYSVFNHSLDKLEQVHSETYSDALNLTKDN